MTRAEAFNELKAKAFANGYKTNIKEETEFPWISVNAETSYINFTITDHVDHDRCDWEKEIYAGHLEVSASISRMGGNPDADELLQAARQIAEAGDFIKELEQTDLSYSNEEVAR